MYYRAFPAVRSTPNETAGKSCQELESAICIGLEAHPSLALPYGHSRYPEAPVSGTRAAGLEQKLESAICRGLEAHPTRTWHQLPRSSKLTHRPTKPHDDTNWPVSDEAGVSSRNFITSLPVLIRKVRSRREGVLTAGLALSFERIYFSPPIAGTAISYSEARAVGLAVSSKRTVYYGLAHSFNATGTGSHGGKECSRLGCMSASRSLSSSPCLTGTEVSLPRPVQLTCQPALKLLPENVGVSWNQLLQYRAAHIVP